MRSHSEFWGTLMNALTVATLAVGLTAVLTVSAGSASAPELNNASDSGLIEDSILTIEVLTRQVLSRNGDVTAAREMSRSAELGVGADGWSDPMLMFGVQNVPTSFDFEEDDMTMRMIGIRQEIPYTGALGLERRSRQIKAAAASASALEKVIDIVISARTAFVTLLHRRESVRLLEAQQSLQEEVVKSISAMVSSGRAEQRDLLAAQAEAWRMEEMLASEKQMVKEDESMLNALRGADIGAPAPELAAPALPEIPESVDSWLDTARSVAPSLRRVRLEGSGYALSAKASSRMRWPMLSVSGSYGFRSGYFMNSHGAERRDDMVSFQIEISPPIFSGSRQGRMSASMQAMSVSAVAEESQIQRELESSVRSLYWRARTLERSIDSYRNRIIPLDTDTYQSALTGFANNRINYVSLANSIANMYRDKLTLNNLERELSVTLFSMARYTTDPAQLENISAARNSDTK